MKNEVIACAVMGRGEVNEKGQARSVVSDQPLSTYSLLHVE